MTPRKQAEAEHDPLHEDMIRNRRRLAPGHWSNSDIDCLLRRLDETRSERDAANRGRDAAKELAAQWGFRLAEAEEQRDSALAAAAEARRLAIEECERIADDYVLVGDIRGRIRALLPPAREDENG